MIKKMFSPHVAPPRFERHFPVGLMMRPSQIRAATKDATHMIPDANAMSSRYPGLACPVAILTGDADKVVDPKSQSQKLHDAIPASMLDVFPGTGHMVHYADPARVVRAIDWVSGSDRSSAVVPLRHANSV
jgi:pimeloyl-ACP methyl ester carboxylesterase